MDMRQMLCSAAQGGQCGKSCYGNLGQRFETCARNVVTKDLVTGDLGLFCGVYLS